MTITIYKICVRQILNISDISYYIGYVCCRRNFMIMFTGDKTTDRIMNIWAKWYEKKYNCDGRFDELDNKELDKLMYDVGMEDFVEFVLQEFPQMENVGYDYDASSTWDMFLRDHKYGYDVEEALSKLMNCRENNTCNHNY